MTGVAAAVFQGAIATIVLKPGFDNPLYQSFLEI